MMRRYAPFGYTCKMTHAGFAHVDGFVNTVVPSQHIPMNDTWYTQRMTGDPCLANLFCTSDKYTLVFDLDETLVHTLPFQRKHSDTAALKAANVEPCDIGDGPTAYQSYICLRPYARETLEVAHRLGFSMIAWTAGCPKHAQMCTQLLDPERKYFRMVIHDSPSWRNRQCVAKDVGMLSIGTENVALIDNNFAAAASGLGRNHICVPDFNGDPTDNVFRDGLVPLLEHVAALRNQNPAKTLVKCFEESNDHLIFVDGKLKYTSYSLACYDLKAAPKFTLDQPPPPVVTPTESVGPDTDTDDEFFSFRSVHAVQTPAAPVVSLDSTRLDEDDEFVLENGFLPLSTDAATEPSPTPLLQPVPRRVPQLTALPDEPDEFVVGNGITPP